MESKKIDFAQYSHHSDIPNPKAFDMATYGVSPSQTPKVGYAQPMGFPLFKVNGWANIQEFPFRAFSLLKKAILGQGVWEPKRCINLILVNCLFNFEKIKSSM